MQNSGPIGSRADLACGRDGPPCPMSGSPAPPSPFMRDGTAGEATPDENIMQRNTAMTPHFDGRLTLPFLLLLLAPLAEPAAAEPRKPRAGGETAPIVLVVETTGPRTPKAGGTVLALTPDLGSHACGFKYCGPRPGIAQPE